MAVTATQGQRTRAGLVSKIELSVILKYVYTREKKGYVHTSKER